MEPEATTATPPQVIPYRDTKPKDYRCPHCGRLLMRAVLIGGCYIETRCPRNRCGRMCVFTLDVSGLGIKESFANLDVT